MSKNEIGITTVLNEINSPLEGAQAKVFSIGWIRKTAGPKRGSLKLIKRAMKQGKTPGSASGGSSRRAPRLKEGKLLLLYDMEKKQKVFAPLETIIFFNGARVRH